MKRLIVFAIALLMLVAAPVLAVSDGGIENDNGVVAASIVGDAQSGALDVFATTNDSALFSGADVPQTAIASAASAIVESDERTLPTGSMVMQTFPASADLGLTTLEYSATRNWVVLHWK